MEILSLFTHNVFSFIFILSIIVFIHEYGHYFFAKRAGVTVESFSIGFGPEVFGFYDKSGTRWKFSALPFGGYVKMYGEYGAPFEGADEEEVKKQQKSEDSSISEAAKAELKSAENSAEEEDNSGKISFNSRNVWWRIAIVSGGPLANFILAIIIFAGFFMSFGKPYTLPVIGDVIENSPAQQIGLQPGDKIIELGGHKITSFEDISGITLINPDIEIELTYERNSEIYETTITPERVVQPDSFGDEVEVGRIGIRPSSAREYVELGIFSSIIAGFTETYSFSVRTLEVLGQMITGQRSAEDLSGVVRIADYSGKAVSQGVETIFWFMAILSINLGLINLFPIPMLDGGHLVFYIIEAVTGKQVPIKIQEYLLRFGFALLITIMLFALYNDFKHFGWVSS